MTPDEFRQRMAALPEPPNNSHPPLWDYWRHDLWSKAQSQVAYSFMGWPCVYHTMLQNHWPEVVEHEYQAVKTERPNMLPACEIPNLFYPYDRHSNTPYSRNLVHQLYHLFQWEKLSGKRLAGLSNIVEFGGGYGALALVARRLGFGGIYEIVDLPEFLLLQHFFLTNVDGAADDRTYIFTNTDLRHIAHSSHDLVIAGYSLSETSYERRDAFFGDNSADSYLLWYSNQFVDYDNIEYFQQRLPVLLPDLKWKHWRVTHMPPETWYSVGWKV